MTTASLPNRGTATLAYSAARMQIMDRADRITRVLFASKRRGNLLTALQAAEIVDAEIDAKNITAVAVAVVNSAAQTLARVQRATKIARLMFTGLTAIQAAKVVDSSQPNAMTVVAFSGTQTAANDATVKTGVVAQVFTAARQAASKAFRKLSGWFGVSL